MREIVPHGSFGPFYSGGQEILRRIFVTVRDAHWREIAPSEWICTLDESRQLATVKARHVSDLVDFEWQGTLQTSVDGRSVVFAFEGEARRTMDICRLGLVVLHPVDAMLGAQIAAQGPDGTETLLVSSSIAPQPIVEGRPVAMLQPFTSLRIERADIGRLALGFDGDLFEMEDQRNWGDASFKTYCTPLRLGFPKQVTRQTRIAQRVAVEFVPASAGILTRVKARPRAAASGIFPNVGSERRRAVESTVEELDWHHRYVDLAAYWGSGQLSRLLERCRSQQLEIGVVGPPRGMGHRTAESAVVEVVSWIAAQRARVARVLVSGEGSSPASAASLEDWRQALVAAGAPEVRLFSATRGYFVEFNRAVDAMLGVGHGIAFPLCATVHGDDRLMIAENVATIGDMAETARRVTQAESLCVAPLALYYPTSAATAGFPCELIDAWLAATLLYAATGGVGTVTLGHDVVSGASVSLLEGVIRCAGLSVSLLPGQPSGVHAAVLRGASDRAARVLAINLYSVPSEVNLKLEGDLRLLQDKEEGRAERVAGNVLKIEGFGVRWFERELN